MEISEEFKTAISDTFFDKTLEVYSVSTTTNAEGQERRDSLTHDRDIAGNVHFEKLERVQKDFGLDEEVSVTFTTQTTIEKGEVVGYDDGRYLVLEVIPRDSHNFILGGKWS